MMAVDRCAIRIIISPRLSDALSCNASRKEGLIQSAPCAHCLRHHSIRPKTFVRAKGVHFDSLTGGALKEKEEVEEKKAKMVNPRKRLTKLATVS